MAITNVAKPTTVLANSDKQPGGETWATITTTWATETRTWEATSFFSNIARISGTIWSDLTAQWSTYTNRWSTYGHSNMTNETKI